MIVIKGWDKDVFEKHFSEWLELVVLAGYLLSFMVSIGSGKLVKWDLDSCMKGQLQNRTNKVFS